MQNKREYNGASLNSFILALGHSESVIQKLLADVGVDRIDPNSWYDFDWAISVYYKVEALVGRAALVSVGRKIIEAAEFPPGIVDIPSLLQSLGAAYHLNVRGENVGDIICSFDDEHSATLDWTAKGPCALNFGILEGACARYGASALIEHGAGGCVDEGADGCIYHVTW